MMNKKTRKLSKLPDEVRAEIGNFFVDTPPIVDEDSTRLPKLTDSNADYIRTGLTVSQFACNKAFTIFNLNFKCLGINLVFLNVVFLNFVAKME